MAYDGPMQRNPDGTWSPAVPLGWQHVPGGDWEVYDTETPKRAMLYDEDVLMANVTARTRLGLLWRMRRSQRRVKAGRRG